MYVCMYACSSYSHSHSNIMSTEVNQNESLTWHPDRTVKLIKAYQEQNVLWNPHNRGFLHRNARNDAWKTMANTMDITVRDVKKKMNSLIAVFKTQHRRGVAKPRWWSIHMHFLLNIGQANPDNQPKLNTPITYDCSDNSDGSMSYDPDGSDCEFISDEPRKRTYQSAFHEFRAEFQMPKLVPISRDKTSITIIENPVDADDPACDKQHAKIESQTNTSNCASDDDIELYARYLECKLKKYTPHTRNAIQFHINRILYEADMGILGQRDNI